MQTFQTVFLNLPCSRMSFLFFFYSILQGWPRVKKNVPCWGLKSKLIPVHSGGKTLPYPWWLHPLLQSSPSLLGGPSAEAEGLWPQHSHNVSFCCNSRLIILTVTPASFRAIKSVLLVEGIKHRWNKIKFSKVKYDQRPQDSEVLVRKQFSFLFFLFLMLFTFNAKVLSLSFLRYVPWNLHEPERGVFNFEDELDIE